MEIRVSPDILLKQICREYAGKLYALVQENFYKKLCYWCPDLKKTYASLSSTLAHIDDANSKFVEDGSPDFLIFTSGNLAGLISLSPLFDNAKKSEIGYWLADNFVGQGLIAQAFPFVMSYAKDVLKLKALELSTAETNERSQKLPRSFGFVEVGRKSAVEVLEDGSVDHIVWSLQLR